MTHHRDEYSEFDSLTANLAIAMSTMRLFADATRRRPLVPDAGPMGPLLTAGPSRFRGGRGLGALDERRAPAKEIPKYFIEMGLLGGSGESVAVQHGPNGGLMRSRNQTRYLLPVAQSGSF